MVYTKKRKKSSGEKHEFTVKWVVANKKIIKFIEREDVTFKLADNVIEYLDEIKSNVPVNVTIADDKVIFIQKRDDVVSEESEPVDANNDESEKNDASNETNLYTVKAISKTRDYYLFDEAGEKEWFTVAKNVKNFLKNVKKGDVLEIKVEVSNDGKRDVKTIVFAKINEFQKEKPKEEQKQESTKRKFSSRDEESTDKRTVLMTAKDLVVALLNNNKIENKQIKEVLTDLTKACYENIQSL